MANTKESNESYLRKVVYYEGKPVTLYSLDGVTWSSNKNDLVEIRARLIQAKLKILGLSTADAPGRVNTEPSEKVREVSRRAKKVRDISKSIIEIKAEELRSQLGQRHNSRLAVRKINTKKQQIKRVASRAKIDLEKKQVQTRSTKKKSQQKELRKGKPSNRKFSQVQRNMVRQAESRRGKKNSKNT